MTVPVRPPSDIHLVCTDHPGVSDLSSWTAIWGHLRADHLSESPDFTVAATGYPPEPQPQPEPEPEPGPGQGPGQGQG
jgi:hypothetical protein